MGRAGIAWCVGGAAGGRRLCAQRQRVQALTSKSSDQLAHKLIHQADVQSSEVVQVGE